MNSLPREFADNADWWIIPDQVFCGDILSSDKALRILNGRVSQIVDRQNVPQEAAVWKTQGVIAPGFFDIQINGGGGVLFNDVPSQQSIKSIADAHRQLGTTAFLPTVITDAPDILGLAVDAAISAFGENGVKGIHIEGPHISVSRRGTHLAEHIRPLDASTLKYVRRLCELNIPVLITLAPETVTPRQVSELVDAGAVVSIGHSDSDSVATKEVLNSGANAFTHLFNAMSPMLNRAPGVTGTAINSSAYCSFICDGIHVDDEMLKLAIRARPISDRMILISDAMPTVGGPDSFQLYGKTVQLKDGCLVNSEGSLAGAHTTMAESLARVVNVLKIPMEEALRMAISNPARLMGVADSMMLLGSQVSDLIQISPELDCKLLSEVLLSASD